MRKITIGKIKSQKRKTNPEDDQGVPNTQKPPELELNLRLILEVDAKI
ncbi:MAG: hypothetical protein HRU41_38455 [Saprospiraceae bacterium]|nr:hypothetical protein [Saprospiraceae bacterium]